MSNSDELFQLAEKLRLLEQAGTRLGPAFNEAVEALGEDLVGQLSHTMGRWRRTLRRASEEHGPVSTVVSE